MNLYTSLVAFYVDPGSGSMVLQLLLGGVGGLYVLLRLFKERIQRLFGIRPAEAQSPDTAPGSGHNTHNTKDPSKAITSIE